MTPSTPTSARARAGFSLLELIIVVLILGILAAMAQPMLAVSMTSVRLEAAAQEVVTALHYARNVARSAGNECRVSFDAANEIVSVERLLYADELLNGGATVSEARVETEPLFKIAAHPLNAPDPYLIAMQSGYPGLDLQSPDFGGADNVIFRDSGKVSSGGQVVLTYGGQQRTIKVNGITGRISQE